MQEESSHYSSAWELAVKLGLGADPRGIQDEHEKTRAKAALGGKVLEVLRARGYLVGAAMLTEKGKEYGRVTEGKGKAKGRPIVSWKTEETLALLADTAPASRKDLHDGLASLKDEIASLKRELLAAITSTVINLDAKDQALFANALINPPEPNAALRRLWEKYAPATNPERAIEGIDRF